MSAMHGTLTHGEHPRVRDREAVAHRASGWFYYLVAVMFLVPIVTPSGPGQTAIVDLVNLAALGVFAVWAGLRHRSLTVPFLVPVLLILLGSLIGTSNAESVTQSLLTLAQDLYLYFWFVMLVNVMQVDDDLRGLGLAWLWAAVAISIVGVAMLAAGDPTALARMTGLKGPRAAATFYNPNMFADYIVASLFIVWGLGREVGRLLRWGATAVLLLALVTTKSNGGLVALAAGLVAWGVAHTFARSQSLFRVLGMAMLVGTLAVCAAWLSVGWGIGQHSLAELGEGSFLGRVSHSSESRVHIWTDLVHRYARHPLGIGPGNSRQQMLSIGSRERPDSFMSKEAHNDYIGYLVERGPLALLGLLLLIAQALFMMIKTMSVDRGDDDAAVGRRLFAAALIGGLVATTVHSFMIEKLHFRHFWLYLAMLCALAASTAAQRWKPRLVGADR